MLGSLPLVFIGAGCTSLPQGDEIYAPPFADADGPYVRATSEGALEARWVERTTKGLYACPARIGDRLAVQSVEALPAFALALRGAETLGPSQIRRAPNSIFVMADTHGELSIMVELLRAHGVIDDALNWAFGPGALVVLGDILDRSARQTEILWLLYELERQGRLQGGSVHILLGNHETMVMQGDLRYLNPIYSETASALGAASYTELLGPQTVLGPWLRAKPAVMRIGNMLFAHGRARSIQSSQWLRPCPTGAISPGSQLVEATKGHLLAGRSTRQGARIV